MKLRWACAGILLSLVVGVAVDWRQGSISATNGVYRVDVAHELEVASIACARATPVTDNRR